MNGGEESEHSPAQKMVVLVAVQEPGGERSPAQRMVVSDPPALLQLRRNWGGEWLAG